MPVQPGMGAGILEGVMNGGHVLEVDSTPVPGHEDQVVDLGRIGELARYTKHVLSTAQIYTTPRNVHVLTLNQGEYLRKTQLVGRHAVRIELNPDLALPDPCNVYPEDPGNLLKPVLELLGDLFEDPLAEIGRDGHLHDGKLGKVDLKDDRIVFQVAGEVPLGLVHLVPDLLHGVVDINVRHVLNRHHGSSLGAYRAYLLDIFKRFELTFQRDGDEVFHVLGSRALVSSLDEDDGDGDVGVGFPGQGGIGKQSHEKDNEHQEENRAAP